MNRARPRRQSTGEPAAEAAHRSPTAVVAAMRRELAGLLTRVEIGRRVDLGRCRVVCGRLGRAPVILAWTGDGRANAEEGARRLLDELPVGRLLVLGVSGGLSPALGPGALLVARRVLDGGVADVVAAPDPAWLRQALELAEATAGLALSTRALLWRGEQKAAAWRDLAVHEPAAVDLESAAFAAAAAARGVPYLVVRAVCDAADETLPLDLDRCRDRRGAIRRLAVVGRAIAAPTTIVPLWRMRSRVALCSERLARFTLQLIGGGAA